MAGTPLPLPAPATPGHLSTRGAETEPCAWSVLGLGPLRSPPAGRRFWQGDRSCPASPISPVRGLGLAEPLRYPSPPLALLQALAVSDHYPVEVKLTA